MTVDGRQKALELIAEERAKQTGFLDLGNLGLTEVPPELFELTHLRSLNLGSRYCDERGEYRESANADYQGCNALPSVSERISDLVNLVALSLVDNPMSHLSPVKGLSALQNLDCSATRVSDLTPVQGLPNLKSLGCSHTPVGDLTPVQGLPNLTFLGCSYTPVSDLGPLQGLLALESLRCGSTSVKDLWPLQGLPALKGLACWNTLVSDLRPLQRMPALQSLNCGSTCVSDLKSLQGLCALKSLDCRNTQVSDLTPLKSLVALRALTCSYTLVTDLTPLQGLCALRSLDCSSTHVSDLTPLKDLPALKSLHCWSTQVNDLTPLKGLSALQTLQCSSTQANDLTPLQDLCNLKSLHCWSTQVDDLRPLKGLSALQTLHCSSTLVSDLTPLQDLSTLKSLNCSHTQVSDLTPLKSLTALRILNCSSTQASDLAPLKNLTALRSLSCSSTRVSDLTPLKDVTALRSLSCSSTHVSDLAPLKSLTALRSLNCSSTQVRDLTPLMDHPSMESFDASRCSLSDLPRRLVMGKTLIMLRLREATIPGVPGEVLSEWGADNCLGPLRAHLNDLEAGAEEVREAKLVVLGNGRVGKTQICRRLRGLPYDETVPSTHGITVTSEPCSGSDADEALNIWDFGGQDIYHGAHTLFMRTSAVFLVAWHPDFENADEQTVDGMIFRNYPLSYWLEYIRTLGRKDSPVVVAQARCDRPEQEVQRLPVDDALLKFPSLKPCWYSAKTDRGRGALEEALRDAIRSLRERDGIATIGKGRMRVLRQLETWRDEDQARTATEREHRTLSQEEFRSLCERDGDVSSPESLLAYLHNLGAVFYRPEMFLDRIILDQSWALEAVYAVFDRRKAYPLILSQGGRFTQSLLAMTAWRDYSDREQRLFLSLMQSCGIAFVRRKDDRQLGLEAEYLAPDVLPARNGVAAQLSGRWDDRQEAKRLEYEYPFLHPGLMRALLCDVGERSGEAGVYWKYGLWVYEKGTGCRAILEQQMTDERRGKITLKVQGRRHEELARWLRGRIEDRNRLFGYPELAPAVDEFGPDTRLDERSARRQLARVGREVSTAPEPAAEDGTPEARSDRAGREPAFEKPPASAFPRREREVFVSYAWGDETPEGRQRGKVVDDLCTALGRQGVNVRRDRDEMRPGELISEFMDRLTEGDLILVVISDKYLRSEYCMYELFRIYRNCGDKPKRFLRKVIPLIVPDAKVDTSEERLDRAIYWEEMKTRLTPKVQDHLEAVGTQFFKKFDMIREFAQNTSDMLEYLVDKLQPRDFERQAQEGFQEVLSQIRPVCR